MKFESRINELDAGIPNDAFAWQDLSCWRPIGSEGPSSYSGKFTQPVLISEIKIDNSRYGYRLTRGFNLLNYKE